jgi:hypothetical protein
LDKRSFPSGRIYFAVTLLFDSETISFLANNEFLPVNAAVWRNGFRDDNDIFFGMMQDRWAEQGSNLTSAVRDQTIYPWPTHFNLRIDGARSIDIQITATRDAFVYMGTQPARLRVTFAN